jgi:hypothetical protein
VCGQCQPPCAPQQPPFAQAQAEQQGVFVAPQQAGVVQGPSNGFGVRGLEIELPAIRLALPTIRFPSLFRTRANARMLLGGSEAAFVGAGQSLSVGQAVVGQAAVGQAYGFVQPGAAQGLTAEQLRDLQAQQAEALRAQMEALEAARSEAADAKAQAAEEKLRELEEAERRLEEKIRRLQECLRQLLSAEQQPRLPCPPDSASISALPPPAFSFNQPAPLSHRRTTALVPLPLVPQRLPSADRAPVLEPGVQRAAYFAAGSANDSLRRLPPVSGSR